MTSITELQNMVAKLQKKVESQDRRIKRRDNKIKNLQAENDEWAKHSYHAAVEDMEFSQIQGSTCVWKNSITNFELRKWCQNKYGSGKKGTPKWCNVDGVYNKDLKDERMREAREQLEISYWKKETIDKRQQLRKKYSKKKI